YLLNGDPVANSIPTLPISLNGRMTNRSSFPISMSIYLELYAPDGSLYNTAQRGCFCWTATATANGTVGPGPTNTGQWHGHGVFSSAGTVEQDALQSYDYFESRYHYLGIDPGTNRHTYGLDECSHQCASPPTIDFLGYVGPYLADRGYRILGPPLECRHNLEGQDTRGLCFTTW